MPTTPLTTSPRATNLRPAGFTLMEILIALSIFGAGLVMAAALFPAGVSEHEKAVEYTLGTIMCRNGLAMARTQLRHSPTAGVDDPKAILSSTTPIKLIKLHNYPSDNMKPLFQFTITCPNGNENIRADGTKWYTNSYTVTVTPYKAGAPFPGTPTPSLTVTTPLNQ